MTGPSILAAKTAPVIITERLTLRAHAPSDLADCAAMWADPAVFRHIGGVAASREEVWSRLLRYAGLWSLMGYGYWCIRETATNRFVGDAGLAEFKRDIVPGLEGSPESGWALATWAHGRGYALEAMAAILAWADDSLRAEKTVCMIAPENTASIRLAQKLGYEQFATGHYKGHDSLLFERRGGA